ELGKTTLRRGIWPARRTQRGQFEQQQTRQPGKPAAHLARRSSEHFAPGEPPQAPEVGVARAAHREVGLEKLVQRDLLDVEARAARRFAELAAIDRRSEEHTSELQSPYDLVCR